MNRKFLALLTIFAVVVLIISLVPITEAKVVKKAHSNNNYKKFSDINYKPYFYKEYSPAIPRKVVRKTSWQVPKLSQAEIPTEPDPNWEPYKLWTPPEGDGYNPGISITLKAYYINGSTSGVIENNEFGTGQGTSDNKYTDISTSDDIRAVVKIFMDILHPDFNGWTAHWFDFKIDGNKELINSISIVWEGKTGTDCTDLQSNLRPLKVSIYNFDTNSWNGLYSGCSNTDIVVSKVINTPKDINDFVSSDGTVTIVANSTDDNPDIFGDFPDTYTDYIAMNINQ